MCCIIDGMTAYKPGTYVKGDQARTAETPADAVQAVFDGFKLQDETPADETEVSADEQDATATPDSGSAGESSVDPTPDGSPSEPSPFDF